MRMGRCGGVRSPTKVASDVGDTRRGVVCMVYLKWGV